MRTKFIVLIICLSLPAACELDGFLFNGKEINRYELPGNTIPDSLLEMVTFESDNNTLYGYWVKSNTPTRGITILYCHGNKHNIDEYWDRIMVLHDMGVNVFVFDYRGYGLSEGKPSEEGLYEDGQSALNFILSHYQVEVDSLCIYGYSLGNVASIYLAAEKIDPLCLIAESPFASANSLTQASISLDIPALWLTDGTFDNAEKIRHINTPFLLLHGEQDDFVRFRDNGKVIYENAPQPKLLTLVPNAEHTNIIEKLGIDNYKKVVSDWINFSANR